MATTICVCRNCARRKPSTYLGVGIGQSMYEVARYTGVNNLGTAVLLEALIKRPVESLVVASSMSIYGEGLYRDPNGEIAAGQERSLDDLKARRWEVTDGAGNT